MNELDELRDECKELWPYFKAFLLFLVHIPIFAFLLFALIIFLNIFV